jgi:hypothetical protein
VKKIGKYGRSSHPGGYVLDMQGYFFHIFLEKSTQLFLLIAEKISEVKKDLSSCQSSC